MKPSNSALYLRDEELDGGTELLLLAHRDLFLAIDGALTTLALGRAHFRALFFIGRRPGCPVNDLIKLLGITKQSLNRVLQGLLSSELVSLSPGRRDRRQRLLALTPKGLELMQQLARLQRQRVAQAYREAGPEAVNGFRKVMSGLLNERNRLTTLIEGTRE